MTHLKVQTAQNVILDFTTGNVGQRLLSGILDLLVVIIYTIAVLLVYSKLLSINLFDDNVGLVYYLIVVLPTTFYLPVSEYFWNGRTVGKYLLKLRVVRTDGSAPSMGDYVLRWMLRIVDVKLGFLMIFFIPRSPSSDMEMVFMIYVMMFMVLPFPIVGIISMATSKTNQRIGDRVANTVVIRNKRIFTLEDTILKATEEDYQPVYKNALLLSDKDIYTIKKVLDRVDKNQDFAYTEELASKAKELLQIDTNQKPVQLLRTLIKDYNALAKKKDLV